MSRLNYVIKNATAVYFSQFITIILGFITRTIFIRQLGAMYLGVNGLFSNILGLLSLAELGFGTALNFEMYKPIAEGNYVKVNTLLNLYKKIYHLIGTFIFVTGLCLLPFLNILVKDPGNIGNIYIYYILYLINTSISYYSSYLFCISNAEQKVYLSTFITIIFTIILNILHIFVLLIFNSFLFYLFVTTIVSLIKQIFIKLYFDKHYKFILNSGFTDLDSETKHHIKKNVGGLIFSKLATVVTYQTDNIIIALGLNLLIVGYSDNYNMIISYLRTFILSFLTVIIPSLGNMVATENRIKSFKIFKIYDIFDYLIYSFTTICLICLFQPFITLWLGNDKTIDFWSMIVLCCSYYLDGRNHAFMNYKTAHGIFYDIKITCVMSIIINLLFSIIGVKYLGLLGVYIGTCVSRVYSNIRNLRLSYRLLTGESCLKYLLQRVIQVFSITIPILLILKVSNIFRPYDRLIYFIIYLVFVVFFASFWLILTNYKKDEFNELLKIMVTSVKKIVIKLKPNRL